MENLQQHGLYMQYLLSLIILTSILLAITQYFNSRQKDIIDHIKDEIKDKDLNPDNQKPYIKNSEEELKRRWEDILNIEPISTHRFIIFYFSLIISYVFSYIFFLIFNTTLYIWQRWIFIGLGAILSLIVCYLVYYLNTMKKQLDLIKGKKRDIDLILKTLENLSKNG